MKRIRAWIVRIIFGPAQSTPPGNGQLRKSHPTKGAAMIMLGKAVGL